MHLLAQGNFESPIPAELPHEMRVEVLARKYRWLLNELHQGNAFSKESLARALEEANSVLDA